MKKIITILLFIILLLIIGLLRAIGGPVYRYYNPNKYDIKEYKIEDGRFAYSIDNVNYIQTNKYEADTIYFQIEGDFEKIYRSAIFFYQDIILYKLKSSDDFLLMEARTFGTDYYLKEGVSFETMDVSYFQFDIDKNKGKYYIENGVRYDYDYNDEKIFKLSDLYEEKGHVFYKETIDKGWMYIHYKNGLVLGIQIEMIDGEYYIVSSENNKIIYYKILNGFLD